MIHHGRIVNHDNCRGLSAPRPWNILQVANSIFSGAALLLLLSFSAISKILLCNKDSMAAYHFDFSSDYKIDRNKLPLMGCIYCVVVFSWIFCEILISLLFLILAVLESEFIYSQFMTELKSFEEMLFLNHYFLLLMAGMPVLYRLDYSLGLRRWQKRQKR